jgi:DNA-directed RNA polymerase subunit RPC12/RpoP
MSEFKFACPVCGQHITADSHAAGSQLECPTCFRKIVVPQAPTSSDPKFVLSAAEANKPKAPARALPTGSALAVPGKSPLPLVLFLILIGAAGAALFLWRGKIFPKKVETPVVEVPTNTVPASRKENLWSADLTNVIFPESVAAGRVRDRDFTAIRSSVQGGTLTLRSGSGAADISLIIYFYAKQPVELAGKTINVRTNDAIAPRVVLRWKDADQPVSESIPGGYALRMEFGPVLGNRLPGKLFICLPDSSKSYVAGTFNAEIRRPSGPKQPRPRRP